MNSVLAIDINLVRSSTLERLFNCLNERSNYHFKKITLEHKPVEIFITTSTT